MRPHEIFAAMPPEHAEAFFGRLADDAPAMFGQAVQTAALALKSRPRFLMKQPLPKRVAAVRRALARVAAGPVAEEVLAVYFLDCRNDVLVEWLDAIGLEHEKGILQSETPPSPDAATLEKVVSEFRSRDADPDRDLLLRAFAAQSAIDWPDLDALLAR